MDHRLDNHGDETGVDGDWPMSFKIGFKIGFLRGIARGTTRSLRAVFVRRTGRQPTAEEEQALARCGRHMDPEQLVDVFEMPADAFLEWLAAG
jgi:hypothetical protein